METLGIIAEYNPFHHGHAYQIQETRKLYPNAQLIILMSGNVVQRGEFAIIDKWTRAEVAIKAGADLVIELPLIASLQSADYFANWTVCLFDVLKIDCLIFGTETANLSQLQAYLDWLHENQVALDEAVKVFLAEGHAYPKAHGLAVEQLSGEQDFGFDTSSANHLLGIQYLRRLRELDSQMEVQAIPRKTSHENDELEILSGSQIRQKMLGGLDYEAFISRNLYPEFNEMSLVSWPDYLPYLRYQLSVLRSKDLQQIQGIDDGFEFYLLKQFDSQLDFNALLNQLITKRYTQASIQRKLMMILLGITHQQWQKSIISYQNKACLRVLAYNSAGQKLLAHYRNHPTLQLFSNLSQDIESSYALNLRADKIYQLNTAKTIKEQIKGRHPSFIR